MIWPMAHFPGGSAWAMARDIAGGYLLITQRSFAKLGPAELDKLGFELDRMLREARGEQPPLDDIPALQQRNRKIQRLNTAQMMLRSYRMQRRR
jgi:hypothetical protein